MFKRLVSEYVRDELKKGKSIKQIKRQLLKSGYKSQDVDEVLRDYEFREADIKQKEEKVVKNRRKVNMIIAALILFAVVNAIFFYSYFSNPNYVLVEQTPTGLVMRAVSEEELQNIQENINASSEVGGLSGIS